MIHETELVIGKRAPWIVDRHRSGRLATNGVALIHGNTAELVSELLHGIEDGMRPVGDVRIQTPAGSREDRESRSGLLVANANIVVLVERHSGTSRAVRTDSPMGLTSSAGRTAPGRLPRLCG